MAVLVYFGNYYYCFVMIIVLYYDAPHWGHQGLPSLPSPPCSLDDIMSLQAPKTCGRGGTDKIWNIFFVEKIKKSCCFYFSCLNVIAPKK